MIVSRKFRIYPNDIQSEIIENTFNTSRFVYNKLLEEAIVSWKTTDMEFHIPTYGSVIDKNPFLNVSNTDFIFDRHAVSNTKDLIKHNFKRFFHSLKNNKVVVFRKDGLPKGFPKFKQKKTCKNIYTNYHGENVHILSNDRLIKLPVLGLVKYNQREGNIIHDDCIIKHFTISKSKTDKYYCSICCECIDIPNTNGIGFVNRTCDVLNIIGLDYSSSSLYIDSNSEKPGYPKFLKQSQTRIGMLQKKLSRQQKGSNNYNKTLKRLLVLYEKISNRRKDFLHKLSNTITKCYDVICVENIDMREIGKRKGYLKLGKATVDNAFGMFRNMLNYKMNRQPFKLFIIANKWFPSSKTCSCCGFIKKDLTLNDRTFICPNCGYTIDRDFNAALNLKEYALNYINNTYDGIRKFYSK